MFGRKKEMIEFLKFSVNTLNDEVDFLEQKITQKDETIARLEQTIKNQNRTINGYLKALEEPEKFMYYCSNCGAKMIKP